MSFALQHTCAELDFEVLEADKAGIVILCSSHDEGWNQEFAFPADKEKHTTSIAACDEYGKVLTMTAPRGVKHMFKGTDIFVGKVPYLKSEERLTGSSVATAISAGVACLILFCCRYVGNVPLGIPDWKQKAVDFFFSKMLARDNRKYVKLGQFCNNFCEKSNVKFEDEIKEHFLENKFVPQQA
jgi:hypothetical protein